MVRKTRLTASDEVRVNNPKTISAVYRQMGPRSSSRLAKSVAKTHETRKEGVDSTEQKNIENELMKAVEDMTSDSSSDDYSSSSAEDSDDDYEKEIERRDYITISDTDCSEDEEGAEDDIMKQVQNKIDRETKKKRLLKKEKQYYEGIASETDDIVCEFESSDVAKLRKRRLYFRKMMKPARSNKKRRMTRLSPDIAKEHTCDTLVGFGTFSRQLTADVDWDDVVVDQNAARKLFREVESDKDFTDHSEEDEAEIVAHNFRCYQSRNAKERVSQIIDLKMGPFSEKLAGYGSHQSVHGVSQSLNKNYHPGIFLKQDIKIPDELLWDQPLTYLEYVSNQFDAHEKCNNYLNKVYEDKQKETEKVLLEEIRQSVYQKSLAQRCEKLYTKDELSEFDSNSLGDDQFDNLFSADRIGYEDDDFMIKEESDYSINDF